jgi:hypothetical protein
LDIVLTTAGGGVNKAGTDKAWPGHLFIICIGMILLSGSRCFAGPSLDEVLERTGKMVALFWQQVPSFTCTESVRQEKIGSKGKVEYKRTNAFDYLAITKAQDDDLIVEELRLPQKITKDKPDKPDKPSLLQTNGFPTLLLIFHPLYQANYRYQIKQENDADGKLLHIGFEHIPGMRSTCALMLRERIYPLDLRGTAVIDGETGIIQKMTAGLVAPLEEINISVFNIEATYKPQTLSSEPEVRWLPATAVIDVRTARQHWRNIHSFSQYKRFTVQSSESVSP